MYFKKKKDLLYNKIINPITNRKVNITSRSGKLIIKNYLLNLYGGMPSCKKGTEDELSCPDEIYRCNVVDEAGNTKCVDHKGSTLLENLKIEKQLYPNPNPFQNKLDKIPSVKKDKFDYFKDENSEKVFCEKIIRGKKLLFILEKVCHGTNVLPIREIWQDFVENRQQLLVDRFQDDEKRFMDEYSKTLIDIWKLNSKEWENHILDKSYLKNSSFYIHKIFQILIDKKIDHPILKDPSTKKYIEQRNKQQIKGDVLDATTMFHRCITGCQYEKIDTWVAYVIENNDYNSKVENFDKSESGFVYHEENYYKNLEPIILLALTITVDFTQDKPYQYQAGIHRSVDYFYNKGKKISKGVPKLSLLLHGFSSRAIDVAYGNKFRYIFTDPLGSMHKILQEENIQTISGIKYSKFKHETNPEIKEKMNSYLEKNSIKPKLQKFLRIPLIEDPSKEDLLYVHENICIPDNPWHTVVSYNSEFNKLF